MSDSEKKLFTERFNAMGSPCSLSLYCESATQFDEIMQKIVAHVQQLEARYSRYLPNSLISQINANAGSELAFDLDDTTWQLICYAQTAFEISEGLFDITTGVLGKYWDFRLAQLPDPAVIQEKLSLIGWSKIQLRRQGFRLPLDGMELDFGGIVKEFCADTIVTLVKANGFHAGLIDMGGDISIVGPHLDGRPWRVAVSNPKDPTQAIAHIPLITGGLASSGDYARAFTVNGKRYSHIINPFTGLPISGLSAVSVWAPLCVMAGTIATTAMLKNEDDGLQWLQQVGCQYVAVTQDLSVFSNTSSQYKKQ
jgi:FAD:protein FMN transferase